MSLEDRLYPLLRLYSRSPQWVRTLSGRVYRQLPVRVRFGSHYADYLRVAASLEDAQPAQVEAYRMTRLKETLEHAARHCPYYRDLFAQHGFDPRSVQDADDLRSCPMLEKADLQANRDRMVSEAIAPGERLYITTGGSTGVPVGFYLQKGISRPKEQAFLETLWARAGYTRAARLVVIRGHVTSNAEDGNIDDYDATRDWLMLSSYHLTEQRAEEYLAHIERFKPDFLHAYPSAVMQLAQWVGSRGRHWQVPLKGILCGSEWMSLEQKGQVEEVFGCRVYRWYGHSERVVLAGEGRKSANFYFFPTYGFVEFGPPDEEGLQEVIGTTFDNFAMPLIRYRTGDYVRLTRENLEFPWPAASQIAGRGQEFLVTRTGRRISLTAFNMHDSIFDHFVAVQFHQDEPGCAQFRFVPNARYDASRLEELRQRITAKLGEDFQLEFVQAAELEKTPRGKHRWLVSKLI